MKQPVELTNLQKALRFEQVPPEEVLPSLGVFEVDFYKYIQKLLAQDASKAQAIFAAPREVLDSLSNTKTGSGFIGAIAGSNTASVRVANSDKLLAMEPPRRHASQEFPFGRSVFRNGEAPIVRAYFQMLAAHAKLSPKAASGKFLLPVDFLEELSVLSPIAVEKFIFDREEFIHFELTGSTESFFRTLEASKNASGFQTLELMLAKSLRESSATYRFSLEQAKQSKNLPREKEALN